MTPALRHALPAADAAWLRMDRPENLMVIHGLLLCAEPLSRDALTQVFAERLVARFPRFSQRVVATATGPMFEDDPGFDLDAHVQRLALPAPHDAAGLRHAVEQLMVRPLDRDRPLWEAYVLDDGAGASAVLARVHHCLADGIALARVLLSLTDPVDAFAGDHDIEVRPPRPDAGHRGVAGRLTAPASGLFDLSAAAARAVTDEALQTVAHPPHLAELARAAVQDTGTLAKLLLQASEDEGPLRGELSIATRIAWSDAVSTDEVRAAAHTLGVTINDLVVASVAGAVRRYLDEHDAAADRELHALVPFNLRPLDEPLPAWLGNRFGLLLLALPTGVEDRRERIAEAKRRMDEVKHSHEGTLSFGLISSLGLAPELVERGVIDFFTAKGSMVLTNVPGPPTPVQLAGVPVDAVHMWAPASGSVPMSVSVFSYAGAITVGFLTDAGVVPEPQRLADGFSDELRAAVALTAG